MTVRAVVTASGCVAFGGSGYSSDGEMRRESDVEESPGNHQKKVHDALQTELELRYAAGQKPSKVAAWLIHADSQLGQH